MISTIFSDVGGVLLSNGWDYPARRLASDKFGYNSDESEQRHTALVDDFETGRVGLDRYLDEVIFDRPRSFTREQFRDFMFAQSKPLPTMDIVVGAARAGSCLMCTLNNESLALNQHRISTFGLRRYFTCFLSSCFLGVKKPDAAIFRIALQVTQRPAEQCLFIDDRASNVEAARQMGIKGVQCLNTEQLRAELEKNGIALKFV
ncbi:MAG TPA: HAD family phosphatase [Acidobacteriota bacterium]|nr:HAD family phosphatase [Acidobacteriota bacterium]